MAGLYAVHWRGALCHASSLVMTGAVCGMHHTGMAAMRLEPGGTAPDYFTGAMAPSVMGIAVTIAVACVTTIAVMCLFGRQLEDVRATRVDF